MRNLRIYGALLLLASPPALAADAPAVALKQLKLTFTGAARGVLGETLYLTLRTYTQSQRIAVAHTAIDLRGQAVLDLPDTVPDDQMERPTLTSLFPIGKSCRETGISNVTPSLTLATGGGFASSSRRSDTGFVDMDFAHPHPDLLSDTSEFLIYASQDGTVALQSECSAMQAAGGEINDVPSSFLARLNVLKGWNVMQGHYEFRDGQALVSMNSVPQYADTQSNTLEITKTTATTVIVR